MNRMLLAALPLMFPLLFLTCNRAKPAVNPELVEPAWGDAVDGVQVRLVADKRQWRADEVPSFTAEIRNQGQRGLTVIAQPSGAELEFDGQVYDEGMGSDFIASLPPGKHFIDIRITLAQPWQGAEELRLALGKHTVRVAFYAGPGDWKDRLRPLEKAQITESPQDRKVRQQLDETIVNSRDVRAVSNPIEIEILGN